MWQRPTRLTEGGVCTRAVAAHHGAAAGLGAPVPAGGADPHAGHAPAGRVWHRRCAPGARLALACAPGLRSLHGRADCLHFLKTAAPRPDCVRGAGGRRELGGGGQGGGARDRGGHGGAAAAQPGRDRLHAAPDEHARAQQRGARAVGAGQWPAAGAAAAGVRRARGRLQPHQRRLCARQRPRRAPGARRAGRASGRLRGLVLEGLLLAHGGRAAGVLLPAICLSSFCAACKVCLPYVHCTYESLGCV